MRGDSEPMKCFKNNNIAVKDADNWVVRGRERPAHSGLPLTADAALVTPAHALPEAEASTRAGPMQVPDSDQSRYFTSTK